MTYQRDHYVCRCRISYMIFNPTLNNESELAKMNEIKH